MMREILDHARALVAFIEDGGDPWEIKKIEEAFGIELEEPLEIELLR